MIPDERDQIEAPKRPDSMCSDHSVIQALLDRVAALEEEVRSIREAGAPPRPYGYMGQ